MTPAERLRRCLEDDSVRAPRARQIAKLLETAGFVVSVEPWTTSTDRKVGRLRIEGKGREGVRVCVYPPGVYGGRRADRILTHTTSETGRTASWPGRRSS